MPDLTTNLVFMVMSSNSKSIASLDAGYSVWRMLKTDSERSLRL